MDLGIVLGLALGLGGVALRLRGVLGGRTGLGGDGRPVDVGQGDVLELGDARDERAVVREALGGLHGGGRRDELAVRADLGRAVLGVRRLGLLGILVLVLGLLGLLVEVLALLVRVLALL